MSFCYKYHYNYGQHLDLHNRLQVCLIYLNPLNHLFKSQNKILYLIQSSDKIIASSPELSLTCNNITKTNKSFYISLFEKI